MYVHPVIHAAKPQQPMMANTALLKSFRFFICNTRQLISFSILLAHWHLTFFDPQQANKSSSDKKKLAPPIPENVTAGFTFTWGFAPVESLTLPAFCAFSKSSTEYVIRTKLTREAMTARTRIVIRERRTQLTARLINEMRCLVGLNAKLLPSSSSRRLMDSVLTSKPGVLGAMRCFCS